MTGLRLSWMLLIGVLLPLAGASAANDIKIGFVNTAKLLDKAPQAEAARDRLEQEFAPRDRDLVTEQRALRKKEDELANDSGLMSESQRRDLEREILALRRELKRSQEAFREDFNFRRNEELNKLQRQIYEAIVELAKENGFDLIVNDGAVIYASDQVDITNKVLERLAK